MMKSMLSFTAVISDLVHNTICRLTVGYIGMLPQILDVLQCNQLVWGTK